MRVYLLAVVALAVVSSSVALASPTPGAHQFAASSAAECADDGAMLSLDRGTYIGLINEAQSAGYDSLSCEERRTLDAYHEAHHDELSLAWHNAYLDATSSTSTTTVETTISPTTTATPEPTTDSTSTTSARTTTTSSTTATSRSTPEVRVEDRERTQEVTERSGGGQESTTSAESDPMPADGSHNAQTLDNATAVTSAVYDEQNGTVVLVLDSKIPQRVVVTDAGGVWSGGQIAQVATTVTTGRSVIRIRVTEYESMVGVTIGTRSGLYGVPIRDAQGSFWPDDGSDRAALAVGSAMPVGLALAWKRRKDRKGDVGVTEV